MLKGLFVYYWKGVYVVRTSTGKDNLLKESLVYLIILCTYQNISGRKYIALIL